MEKYGDWKEKTFKSLIDYTQCKILVVGEEYNAVSNVQ